MKDRECQERIELIKEALKIIHDLGDQIFEDYDDFCMCQDKLKELVRKSRILRRSKHFSI